MTSEGFRLRSDCPACSHVGRPVFSRAYSDPVLRRGLVDFYAQVGRIDLAALEGQSYSVARCERCASWFQSSVPSDALLDELYEKWIDPDQARTRFHEERQPEDYLGLARELFLALSLMPQGAPRTMLDIGCGWGEWGRMAQAFACETWGTELSPSRREYCRQLAMRIVPDSDLPDRYFGHINLDQVLEHLPEPLACLQTLVQKLHPLGVLKVSVPNPWRVGKALKHFDHEIGRPRLGDLNAIAPLEHLNAFSQTGLLTLAGTCGLFQIRPSWSALLSALVLRKRRYSMPMAVLRACYLRSSYSTNLYFRHASAN